MKISELQTKEAAVVWNKNTGRPVYHAIIVTPRQTQDICAELKSKDLEPIFKDKTGLLLDIFLRYSKMDYNVEGAEKLWRFIIRYN